MSIDSDVDKFTDTNGSRTRGEQVPPAVDEFDNAEAALATAGLLFEVRVDESDSE